MNVAEFTADAVVDLAKQIIANDIPREYTTSDAQEALRQSLIEANGGSAKINPRTFRNMECYDIIEKIIDLSIEEGLTGNEFWNTLVESVKVDNGDRNEFYVEDTSFFIVSEIGRGNQGIRRQRYQSGSSITLAPHSYAVRTYEHMDRIMSGRIDFTKFVKLVGDSFVNDMLQRVYEMFMSINATTDGMYNDVYKSGTYDEDTLLNIIDHIQADTGATPIILGSRPALRNLKMTVMSHEAESSLYNTGYYGKFYGVDTVVVPQRNKVGTHDFIFPDDRLYVMAGDDKPIKSVEEGDAWMDERDFNVNGDLTREYCTIKRVGLGLLLRYAIGTYIIAKP